MSLPQHHLELLAPAKTADIGIEAVLHGADAVYIGGPSFGARANAENSIADIARLADFARPFGARIFATLNTILHDSELEPARKQAWELYDAGVDALIVQDMGLLELDLPPLALHASTQCDIRDVTKASFLSQVGFSQLVLARELTLEQIQAIRAAVAPEVALEFFIHGALCVAFSGQCYISHAHTGRSANRGDCSQACRLPYTLTDKDNRVVAFDKHLLSLKDNNQSANMAALVDAGIRSFKIEGRYKDATYVKNVTAHYRQLLDQVLEARPELARASAGRCTYSFRPDPEKTFNRKATDYFVNGRLADIGAFDAPTHTGKLLGEVTQIGPDWFDIRSIEPLANGDGLTWMYKREVRGLQVNVAKAQGPTWRLFPNQKMHELEGLSVGTQISRNRDHAWEQALAKKSAERRIGVRILFAEYAQGFRLSMTDETGLSIDVTVDPPKEPAQNVERAEQGLRDNLGKLGTTLFVATDIAIEWSQAWFLPASIVNALRREACDKLLAARIASWQRASRAQAAVPAPAYPEESLSYLANVYNHAARSFYERHGVKLIAEAYEAHKEPGEVSLMITKHCLRFSFNLCPKQAKGVQGVQGQVRAEPMTLASGNEQFTLSFDCKRCEMHVMGKMKRHIFQSAPPSLGSAPIVIHRTRRAHSA